MADPSSSSASPSTQERQPPAQAQALLRKLEHPDDLKTVLKREADQYDCLSCRVMGASAFIGLGAYTYWDGHRQLKLREKDILKTSKINMAARRLGITGLATMLVGLGAYRAFA